MVTSSDPRVYAVNRSSAKDSSLSPCSERPDRRFTQLRRRIRQLLHAERPSTRLYATTSAHNTVVEQGPSDTTDSPASSQNSSPNGSKPPQNVSYRSLLRNRNFRMLWLGEAISTFGSLFTRLAIPVYVYNVTGSSLQLGLSVFFSLIASLIFGLLSGVLVDRWDRRRAMIATNLLNGVILLLLVGLVIQNPPLPVRLAAIYALSFVAALLRDFFAAARVAILPDVISEQEYLTANALDQSTIQFAELLSYPLSILVLWLGPTLAFGLDAATFFVSAALLSSVTVTRTTTQGAQESTIIRDIAAGLRTVRQLELVRRIVLLSFIVPIIFSLMFTLQLLYAVDVAGSTNVVGFPLLEGAMALGFVIGALLLGRWGKHTARGLLLAYGLTGMGLAVALQGGLPYIMPWLGLPTVIAAWQPWTPLLLAATLPVLLGGMTNSLVNTGIRTVVQEQTPRTAIGRVYSVIQVASSFGFALGALLTPFATGRVALTLVGLGALLLLLGLFSRTWLANAERSPARQSELEMRT